MTEKILIIDDDKDLVMLLEDELSDRGYTVLTAYNGEEGIARAQEQPDLILLDIMLPGTDGFEVCRQIRDAVLCPILFLSARQSEMDKIKGLNLGGDDYITKPFGLNELLARVAANLRREMRTQGTDHRRAALFYGKLRIDLRERAVLIAGRNMELTRREYDIVELLATRPGQIFSREQIYEHVWGYDATGDNTTVVEHVKKIRAKLATADAKTEYISTVWGIGYKWNRQ